MKKSLLLLALFASLSVLADICPPVDVTWLQKGQTDWDEGFYTDDPTVWSYNSTYGAIGKKKGGYTGMLITPAQNLTGANSITLNFQHAINFASDMSNLQTLWVCPDYTGDIDTSDWTQLTIPDYPAGNNWTFVSTSVIVPDNLVGPNTVFCFKYISTESNFATWEIKDLHLTASFPNDAVCSETDDRTGRLRIAAHNVRNYFYNYATASVNIDYDDEEGFIDKTNKLVNSILSLNADIYALCELEAQDIVLRQLVDTLNRRTGSDYFSYVVDGLSYDRTTKSGFLYRNDIVKPIGKNITTATSLSYKERMRAQTFEEIATGERFTLSMNHFKAKDNTEDEGEAIRISNASELIANLPSAASLDPDILILGDFNCTYGEKPVTMLEDAGYTEQTLLFDDAAYSHCHNWSGQLIDHVFANASMAEQITDIKIIHTCTTCEGNDDNRYTTSFSDHDPYYVELDLFSTPSDECEDTDITYLLTEQTTLGEMTTDNSSVWKYDASYHFAKGTNRNGGTGWLLTPAKDMSNIVWAAVDFEHAINYADDMQTQQTLWITGDFVDVESSEWTQITIPQYPAGSNWTFVSSGNIELPTEKLGRNTVIGFKYISTSDKYATWEIRNLRLQASCNEPSTADDICVSDTPNEVRRIMENGQLHIILPDGRVFNSVGQQMQQRQ